MKVNKIFLIVGLTMMLSACGSTGQNGASSFLNAVGNGLGMALGAMERAGDKMTPKSQTRCYELYGELRCDTY